MNFMTPFDHSINYYLWISRCPDRSKTAEGRTPPGQERQSHGQQERIDFQSSVGTAPFTGIKRKANEKLKKSHP
jgi:hypothetical protein